MELGGQLNAPAALPPGQAAPGIHFKEVGWASEMVWALWRKEKSPPLDMN
jgi:hypothetical protein